MENLFSYGTLQSESVQLSTFGRKLEGYADCLVGYKLTFIKIEDETVIASNWPLFRESVEELFNWWKWARPILLLIHS